MAQPAVAPSPSAPAPASDQYLAALSDESLEVLQHFGTEAPALLNRYACVVEDALINQAKQSHELGQQAQQIMAALEEAKLVIGAAAEDNAAYHTLLTEPNLLSDYVIDFFGENGPYPVETPRSQLAAEVAAAEAAYAPQLQAMVTPSAQVIPQQPAFQRPQLDMPAPGAQSSRGSDFWDTFEQVSASNPGALYQLLSQASPDDLRSRILIAERPD
jgi:hypothetical protein